jgi:FkbM family methyltransferase
MIHDRSGLQSFEAMASQLVSAVIRLAYPFGSVRRIWRGPLRGLRYEVGPGIGFTYALGRGYGFERFAGRLAPGMVIYDIGANRGQMSLFFSRSAGDRGRVFAFEPVPHLADTVRRNLALNGVTNVQVATLALSDRVGHATLDYDDQASTQGKLAEVEPSYRLADSRPLTVETTTIDTLIRGGHPRPQFMKIDVEGAAARVLSGAREVLSRADAPLIYVEVHGPEERRGLRDHLLGAGYSLWTLDGTQVEDPEAGRHSWLWALKAT